MHEKAIYLHQGQQYYVHQLDIAERRAYVKQVDSDYFTDAITYTKVKTLETMESVAEHNHGEVHVAHQVVGFKKIKFFTMENVGSGDLNLPVQEMHTTAYWLTVPQPVIAALPYAPDDRRDGVVGLSFAMKQVAQLLLMCDGHDIGISLDTEAEHPRVFVYDNYPGGIGFSEPLFRMHHELVEATRRLIADCDCGNGCPGCVGPIGNTGPLAKAAALAILDLMLANELAA